MASVVFENISKAYGATPVVRDLNLEVRQGEFLVLLGPSGCGKTTSLRMVAGFVHPSAGDIRIGGESVVALPPRRRNIGMVFQDYSLFPNMSVAENIAFGLVERRVARPAIRRRVAELLDLIRLPELGARLPGELSGGQQQRVALARALAYSPRVLLMDEPLGALDLKLREAMQAELARVQRELGITTIFVTHDQEEALTLADRIVVMADGAVEQIGTPEALYRRPETAFVADFVGKINLLPGRVAARDERSCRVLLETGASVRVDGPCPVPAGEAALVAIRPEALHFVAAGDSESDAAVAGNHLIGTVERRRFLGSVLHYGVAIGEHAIVVARPAGEAAPAPGDRVGMIFAPDQAVVLAARAGTRG